jgi:hypothetical protein
LTKQIETFILTIFIFYEIIDPPPSAHHEIRCGPDYVFPFMIQQGLSTSTLASSFGKVITSMKNLSDYRPEDLASTLLSAFTYNIAQVSLCYIRLQVIELLYLLLHLGTGKY